MCILYVKSHLVANIYWKPLNEHSKHFQVHWQTYTVMTKFVIAQAYSPSYQSSALPLCFSSHTVNNSFFVAYSMPCSLCCAFSCVWFQCWTRTMRGWSSVPKAKRLSRVLLRKENMLIRKASLSYFGATYLT